MTLGGHNPVRYHQYDLTKPVSGTGATSLGLCKGSGGDDFFMRAPISATVATLDAMPVGLTTEAESFEMRLGQGHSLVFGSKGAFYGQDGSGTTRARVTRRSATEWTLELPIGSRRRLWLRPRQTPGPQRVDKGLYEFSAVVELDARR